MKKTNIIISLPFLLLSLVGCGGSSGGGDSPIDKEAYDDTRSDYYDLVERRNKFDEYSELSFNDEITNGLDDSVWNTLDGYWENGGTTPHNGVRRRNLFYTKDKNNNGYLVLKARGLYNLEDPATKGLPEGACIETKSSLGPGRYEVEMAALPREGGVTALWTYKCESTEAVSQNEIDIEIGGGGQFNELWTTTWTKKTNKATHAPDVSNICYMNDGKIHKYTFDWYTEYGDTNEGRVDWFIDGKFVQSISGGTITDIDMPLWLGVWMPSWAGNATWVSDYILVDRVSYTAFDENQYYVTSRAYNTYSPKDPSKSDIQNIDFASITTNLNKLSNPSFENDENYISRETGEPEAIENNYGWKQFNPSSFPGTKEFVSDASEGSKAFKITSANKETDKDGYFYQRLSCAYEGYKYHLSIDAKLVNPNDNAEVLIWQRNKAGTGNLGQEHIPLTSTTYNTYEADIVMNKNACHLDIFLHVIEGSAIYDNVKLFRVMD